MKFGSAPIPASIFDMAYARMRREATFTPEDIRTYLLRHAKAELSALSSIETNQRIIANRVMRACVNTLREAGEIEALKRGVWAKTSFLAAAR